MLTELTGADQVNQASVLKKVIGSDPKFAGDSGNSQKSIVAHLFTIPELPETEVLRHPSFTVMVAVSILTTMGHPSSTTYMFQACRKNNTRSSGDNISPEADRRLRCKISRPAISQLIETDTLEVATITIVNQNGDQTFISKANQ